MEIIQIFTYIFMGFSAGYLSGRIGHYYLNDLMNNPAWLPHHWIYGAALIPASSYFLNSFWGIVILFFGIGHFISDFNDFTRLKFFGPDENSKKRFFHID
ncbi:MAG: hypothetical protein AAB877_00425 [Patescibacteria group bacterium]